MAASSGSASSGSCRQRLEIPASEKSNEERHALKEECLHAATDQMLKDPALQQIIWANVHMLISEVFRDVFEEITDVERHLSGRMERLERLLGISERGVGPVPRDVPPPLQGLPHCVSSPMSSPMSSPRSSSTSSARSPSSSTLASPQPSRLARGHHSGRFRAPVPFRCGTSQVPATVKGRFDWKRRQSSPDSDLACNRSGAPREQERQRRGGRRDTRERTSVVPESLSTPGRQGRHSSPHAVEGDDDAAFRLEQASTKEEHGGRLQRLMGKYKWWSSHG
mmetsp:Transcript_58153/g.170040  ORF Transcript_58153/g.170040 Transcript_58153/m.170040 type:complete len:280 (-) Transcript_58153:302-1141(-)